MAARIPERDRAQCSAAGEVNPEDGHDVASPSLFSAVSFGTRLDDRLCTD